MAGCGYTPAEIDAMALDDVRALLEHWRCVPPLNEAVAAACGLGARPRDPDDPSGIGPLIARRPDGMVR